MQMYTGTQLTTAIHIRLSPQSIFRGGGFQRLCVNVALLTADFIVMYTSGFSDMIQW